MRPPIDSEYCSVKNNNFKKILPLFKEIKTIAKETFSKDELIEFNMLLGEKQEKNLTEESEKELTQVLALTKITTREHFELLNSFVGASVNDEALLGQISIANNLLANFENRKSKRSLDAMK